MPRPAVLFWIKNLFSSPNKKDTEKHESNDQYLSQESKIEKLLNNGNYRDAEISCKILLESFTDNGSIYGKLGAACGLQGKYEEMLEYSQMSIDLNFSNPSAHNNLGYALKKKQKLSEAISSFRTAIDLNPNFIDAYINLGISLREIGSYTEAIATCKKAINLSPDRAEAYNCLGAAQLSAGHIDQSINSYKTAIALKNSAKYHVNLAMAYFLNEDYRKGWTHYAKRKGLKNRYLCLKKTPDHEECELKKLPKHGTILVVLEQGLGDTLQFIRFYLYLKKIETHCKLCAPKRLHQLIIESGIDNSPITPIDANTLTSENWISLLSLPEYFGVNQDSPRQIEPYITSPKELRSKWQKKLTSNKKIIVGLNWEGNRKDIEKSKRNIPLTSLAPILENTKAAFVSIQRGAGQKEFSDVYHINEFMQENQEIIHHLANSNGPQKFLEYAAVIQSCDLIITSATTTAHLAAAMGKPTWILLNKVPDWRWGLRGDTTFWYPTARLFRQQEHGNWNDVVKTVASELSNLTKDHSWIKKSDI